MAHCVSASWTLVPDLHLFAFQRLKLPVSCDKHKKSCCLRPCCYIFHLTQPEPRVLPSTKPRNSGWFVGPHLETSNDHCSDRHLTRLGLRCTVNYQRGSTSSFARRSHETIHPHHQRPQGTSLDARHIGLYQNGADPSCLWLGWDFWGQLHTKPGRT